MTTFTLSGQRFVLLTNSRKIAIPQCLTSNPSTHSTRVSHYGVGPAVSQLFRLNQRNNQYQQIALIHTEPVFDVKVIQDELITPCLVFAIPVANGVLGHPIVLCLDNNANFNLRETIPLTGIDQVFLKLKSTSNYINILIPMI